MIDGMASSRSMVPKAERFAKGEIGKCHRCVGFVV